MAFTCVHACVYVCVVCVCVEGTLDGYNVYTGLYCVIDLCYGSVLARVNLCVCVCVCVWRAHLMATMYTLDRTVSSTCAMAAS